MSQCKPTFPLSLMVKQGHHEAPIMGDQVVRYYLKPIQPSTGKIAPTIAPAPMTGAGTDIVVDQVNTPFDPVVIGDGVLQQDVNGLLEEVARVINAGGGPILVRAIDPTNQRAVREAGPPLTSISVEGSPLYSFSSFRTAFSMTPEVLTTTAEVAALSMASLLLAPFCTREFEMRIDGPVVSISARPGHESLSSGEAMAETVRSSISFAFPLLPGEVPMTAEAIAAHQFVLTVVGMLGKTHPRLADKFQRTHEAASVALGYKLENDKARLFSESMNYVSAEWDDARMGREAVTPASSMEIYAARHSAQYNPYGFIREARRKAVANAAGGGKKGGTAKKQGKTGAGGLFTGAPRKKKAPPPPPSTIDGIRALLDEGQDALTPFVDSENDPLTYDGTPGSIIAAQADRINTLTQALMSFSIALESVAPMVETLARMYPKARSMAVISELLEDLSAATDNIRQEQQQALFSGKDLTFGDVQLDNANFVKRRQEAFTIPQMVSVYREQTRAQMKALREALRNQSEVKADLLYSLRILTGPVDLASANELGTVGLARMLKNAIIKRSQAAAVGPRESDDDIEDDEGGIGLDLPPSNPALLQAKLDAATSDDKKQERELRAAEERAQRFEKALATAKKRAQKKESDMQEIIDKLRLVVKRAERAQQSGGTKTEEKRIKELEEELKRERRKRKEARAPMNDDGEGSDGRRWRQEGSAQETNTADREKIAELQAELKTAKAELKTAKARIEELMVEGTELFNHVSFIRDEGMKLKRELARVSEAAKLYWDEGFKAEERALTSEAQVKEYEGRQEDFERRLGYLQEGIRQFEEATIQQAIVDRLEAEIQEIIQRRNGGDEAPIRDLQQRAIVLETENNELRDRLSRAKARALKNRAESLKRGSKLASATVDKLLDENIAEFVETIQRVVREDREEWKKNGGKEPVALGDFFTSFLNITKDQRYFADMLLASQNPIHMVTAGMSYIASYETGANDDISNLRREALGSDDWLRSGPAGWDRKNSPFIQWADTMMGFLFTINESENDDSMSNREKARLYAMRNGETEEAADLFAGEVEGFVLTMRAWVPTALGYYADDNDFDNFQATLEIIGELGLDQDFLYAMGLSASIRKMGADAKLTPRGDDDDDDGMDVDSDSESFQGSDDDSSSEGSVTSTVQEMKGGDDRADDFIESARDEENKEKDVETKNRRRGGLRDEPPLPPRGGPDEEDIETDEPPLPPSGGRGEENEEDMETDEPPPEEDKNAAGLRGEENRGRRPRKRPAPKTPPVVKLEEQEVPEVKPPAPKRARVRSEPQQQPDNADSDSLGRAEEGAGSPSGVKGRRVAPREKREAKREERAAKAKTEEAQAKRKAEQAKREAEQAKREAEKVTREAEQAKREEEQASEVEPANEPTKEIASKPPKSKAKNKKRVTKRVAKREDEQASGVEPASEPGSETNKPRRATKGGEKGRAKDALMEGLNQIRKEAEGQEPQGAPPRMNMAALDELEADIV